MITPRLLIQVESLEEAEHIGRLLDVLIARLEESDPRSRRRRRTTVSLGWHCEVKEGPEPGSLCYCLWAFSETLEKAWREQEASILMGEGTEPPSAS